MHQERRYSSFRKCRFVFKLAALRYPSLQKRLSDTLMLELEALLEELDVALKTKNLSLAQEKAKAVDLFLQTHARKSLRDHLREFVVALVIALAVAGVVRQTWFELYEIPTGSMRPTFRENDRVFVLKTTFGINVPFRTQHFFFDPKLVKRGSITVISGDGIDLPDTDTTYFLLFPGKKRYVKRCVALPGDTIYFYGGQIWGIDSDGAPFTPPEPFLNREYLPLSTFEGRYPLQVESEQEGRYTFLIRQMNIPLARISISKREGMTSQIETPNGWTAENFTDTRSLYPRTYMQFWGIGNYATCKLLLPDQLPQEAKRMGYGADDAQLYVEIKHSPTLPSASATQLSTSAEIPIVLTKTSWLALNAAQCDTLRQALYTARFCIKNGRALRFSQEMPKNAQGLFIGSDIPDGCYEFYNGIAYQIGWGSIAYALPPTHPIYPTTPERLKTLYNAGIDFFYSVTTPESALANRSRYGYFKNGDFFLMGAAIATKDSQELQRFIERERARAQSSSYIPFLDAGAPDADRIKQFGLKLPEKQYLLLGDNHAMSQDSRYFGFVPEKNLQGSPEWILWPPGSRWGALEQPSYPFLRYPNVVVLIAAALLGGLFYAIYRDRTGSRGFYRRRQRRISHKP